MAVFGFPSVLNSSASVPTAVFSLPVVLFKRAAVPTAVLSSPRVLNKSDAVPNAVFSSAVLVGSAEGRPEKRERCRFKRTASAAYESLGDSRRGCDLLASQREYPLRFRPASFPSGSARRKQCWNRGAGACLKCLEFSCYEGYDRDNNNNNSMKVSTARFICRLLCQSASNHY